MKILIYSYAYDLSGSTIRAALIARGLQRVGAEVAISGYSIPEALAVQLKSYILPADRPGLESLVAAAKDFQPDWIFGITEGAAEWVISASKKVNCRAAFDLHAIGVFEIIELGKGYGNRIERLKMSMQNLINVAKGDVIVTCAPNLYWLVKLFVGRARVLDVTGMVDLDLFTQCKTEEVRLIGDKYRVFYIGNYYKWQGVNVFLDAAERVYKKSNQFEFFVLGSLGKEQVSKTIGHHPIFQQGKVSIVERVDHNKVPYYMQSADILVVPRPLMLSTYFAFPSKLCEYMASGKYIIATNISPHRWALEHPKCGELCYPSSKALADVILRYEPHEAAILAGSARQKARECFDYIKQCRIIYQSFQEIMSS